MTVSGKSIDSSRIGSLRVAQRVAGDRMPQADDADDVAGRDRVDLLAAVGLDVPELRHVFLLVLARVEHAAVGLQLAGIDADVVQVAVPVGLDLEHQAAERLVGSGLRICFCVGLLRDRRLRPAARRPGWADSSATASSSGCTPMPSRAEPHSTGTIRLWIVASRSTLADQLGRHRRFGQQQLGQLVAVHRTAGRASAPRHSSASSCSSAGISAATTSAPLLSGVKREHLHRDQVDHAAKGVLHVRRAGADGRLIGDRLGSPAARGSRRACRRNRPLRGPSC